MNRQLSRLKIYIFINMLKIRNKFLYTTYSDYF